VNASHSETAGFGSVAVRVIGPGALVFCATVLAYLPSLSGKFIWNDSDYVTAPSLRSLGGLARIWTQPGATEQYYPLLHTVFWVQHRLWGDHPLGYHIVTLLLHAGSAVLFALILRRLLVSDPAQPAGVAWLGGLLFALHPVHAESVAWIAEQKNTLSLAFYLAAALAYLRFDETRRPRTYAAALAFFALSLLSKTVTATLPAALLVILWWKRGRLDWRRDVLPLTPWLGLGAAAGLFSSWVERAYVGAQGAGFDTTAITRALVAGRAVWFYAGKLVWPFGLTFVYPRWTVDPAVWWQWLFPLGVLGVGAALWSSRRYSRGPMAAFLLFVGSLFPALGFVNLYGARYSWVWDHWQYLPDLGPLALGAAGLAAGWRHAGPHLCKLGPWLAAALAVLLGGLTWSHCGNYADPETLWRTTIDRNPACWMAYNNLAAELLKDGRVDEAIVNIQQALEYRPANAEAYANLGEALGKKGRLEESFAQYRRALEIEPDNVLAQANYGSALLASGRSNEAIPHYERALAAKPDLARANAGLGDAYLQSGRTEEAIGQFQKALMEDANNVGTLANLGTALAQKGRLDDAILNFHRALEIDPHFALARINLGNALLQSGRDDAAIAQFQKALEIDPDSSAAHNGLGYGYMQTGHAEEAVMQFKAAVEIDPRNAGAQRNLDNALLKARPR
jgi:tetratricopeptide (TPR) repeat protein